MIPAIAPHSLSSLVLPLAERLWESTALSNVLQKLYHDDLILEGHFLCFEDAPYKTCGAILLEALESDTVALTTNVDLFGRTHLAVLSRNLAHSKEFLGRCEVCL